MKTIVVLKRVIFVLALVPAARLAAGAFTGGLTANPIDYVTDQTGDWTLRFLVLSLAVTPLRRLSGWNEVVRLRRMLGLFAFFYAALHLLTWAVLDKFFDWPIMFEDVFERPFITVGMAAFLILLALALTSSTAAIRRLGRRWQQLHRLAYAAGVLAVIHYWWLVKADVTEPRRWAVILAALFLVRVWWALRSRRLLPSRRSVAPAARHESSS